MIEHNGLILNDAGTHAYIRYHFQMRKFIELPHKPGIAYVFAVRGSVNIGLVALDDVEYILNLKSGCCGKKKAGVFYPSDQKHVERWLKGA